MKASLTSLLLCLCGLMFMGVFPFHNIILKSGSKKWTLLVLFYIILAPCGFTIIQRLYEIYENTFFISILLVVALFSHISGSVLMNTEKKRNLQNIYFLSASFSLVIVCLCLKSPAAYIASETMIIFLILAAIPLCIAEGFTGLVRRTRIKLSEKAVLSFNILSFATILLMCIPPFGLFSAKWLALELSANQPPVFLAIAAGILLNFQFLLKRCDYVCRIIKKRLKNDRKNAVKNENDKKRAWIYRVAFSISLIAGVFYIAGSASYGYICEYLKDILQWSNINLSVSGGVLRLLNENRILGRYDSWGLFLIMAGVIFLFPIYRHNYNPENIRAAYTCGADTDGSSLCMPGTRKYREKRTSLLKRLFKYDYLRKWTDVFAAALLALIIGVSI